MSLQRDSTGAIAPTDKNHEKLVRFALALREEIRNSALGDSQPVIYGTDNMQAKADKIVELFSNDLFIVKLKREVLKHMSGISAEGSEFDHSVGGLPHFTKKIINAIEEIKLNDAVSMIGVSLYEKAIASAMRRHPFDNLLMSARTSSDETVVCIKDIRIAWEEGINEELQAMALEMNRPFSRKLEKAQHPLLDTCVSGSARENVRFLFDSEDLLETAAAIREPNKSRFSKDCILGLLKVPLVTPSLSELSKRYHELHVYAMQFGVDDLSAQFGVKFCQTRHLCAEDSLGHPLDIMSARKQLRSGAPPALRGKLWRIALNLSPEPSRAEREEYSYLLRQCNTEELLTDDLYIMDVVSVADDASFFVFDDNMREVALCFSRDASIPRDANFLIHAPLYLAPNAEADTLAETEPNTSSSPPIACPPNGIQPFLGFAKYIAPLCYLYLDNVSIYTTMRAMYCRLWCAMNVISSTEGTLYHVCQTFERLLIEGNLNLYSHLASLKVEPLQVCFVLLCLQA